MAQDGGALTTEAFLAAAEHASEASKAAECLSVFVPDPPVKAVDDAVLGPQNTGRTAELFSHTTSPLATLICMYVELI